MRVVHGYTKVVFSLCLYVCMYVRARDVCGEGCMVGAVSIGEHRVWEWTEYSGGGGGGDLGTGTSIE